MPHLYEPLLILKYVPFIEEADIENTVTPTIVIYEVYRKIKGLKGEEKAFRNIRSDFMQKSSN